MTQTMSPEDTGEIKTDPGMATQNLAPYAAGLPPAMRRPGATGELPLLSWPPKRPAPAVDQLIAEHTEQQVTFQGDRDPNHRPKHRLTLRRRMQRWMGGAR